MCSSWTARPDSLQGQDNFLFSLFATKSNRQPGQNECGRGGYLFRPVGKYDQNTRVAQFNSVSSHVRVRDTQFKLDCEALTTTLPRGETNQGSHLDHILAETNVSIDFFRMRKPGRIFMRRGSGRVMIARS